MSNMYKTGLFKTKAHHSLYVYSCSGSHIWESAYGSSRWKGWQKKGLPSKYEGPTKAQTLVLPEEYLT